MRRYVLRTFDHLTNFHSFFFFSKIEFGAARTILSIFLLFAAALIYVTFCVRCYPNHCWWFWWLRANEAWPNVINAMGVSAFMQVIILQGIYVFIRSDLILQSVSVHHIDRNVHKNRYFISWFSPFNTEQTSSTFGEFKFMRFLFWCLRMSMLVVKIKSLPAQSCVIVWLKQWTVSTIYKWRHMIHRFKCIRC